MTHFRHFDGSDRIVIHHRLQNDDSFMETGKAPGIMPPKTYTTKTDLLKHFRHKMP